MVLTLSLFSYLLASITITYLNKFMLSSIIYEDLPPLVGSS
jgi:hypothetical protein